MSRNNTAWCWCAHRRRSRLTGPDRVMTAVGQNEIPRCEHMSAGLPPIADIAGRGWHGRKVPIGDKVHRSKWLLFDHFVSADKQ